MVAMRCKPRAGAKVPLSGRLGDGSDQAEAAKARMALLADDDVVVHEDAERVSAKPRIRHSPRFHMTINQGRAAADLLGPVPSWKPTELPGTVRFPCPSC